MHILKKLSLLVTRDFLEQSFSTWIRSKPPGFGVEPMHGSFCALIKIGFYVSKQSLCFSIYEGLGECEDESVQYFQHG